MRKNLAILGIAALVALSACGTDPTINGTDADPADTPAEAAGEPATVGVTFSDLGNPVWAELVREATSYGEELDLNLTSVDAQGDASTQVTQIENFIQSGVDAIIITAVESNSLTDVTARAQDAGIKVVGYTQVLENYDAQYLVNAYDTGYANGERAAEWLNENYPDEEVEWGLMDLPVFPEIIDRANGIKDAIEEHAPQAVLVATAPALTTEDGVRNAENFLQANPDMKMIATIGGGGASGGNTGIKTSGITDFDSFGLFGIDATEQEILAIIDGDPQKASISLGGGKAHGRTLVEMTRSLLDGEDIEKDQYMPITVIDASNAQEYYDEVYGG